MKCKKYYVHSALIFAAMLCVAFAQDDAPQVDTQFGTLRGVWLKTLRNATIAGFIGIPYAQPPLGELRFESSQPWTEKWNDTRDAVVDGPNCLQMNSKGHILGDEDCLFLNVYAPNVTINENATETKKLSVLVFIYGGGLKQGSSNSSLYAPTYLLDHEVVLVTMNYRLDAFGFFSTGNDVTPGNYGLKDIALALEWVRDNVEVFGGDRKSVTLVGSSSGSGLAQLLSASKRTEGLFHKIITTSGTALSSWAFRTRETVRNASMILAEHLGCFNTTDNTTEIIEELGSGDGEIETTTIVLEILDEKEQDRRIVQCMKNASAIDIVTAGLIFSSKLEMETIFGPTLEAQGKDAILTVHPTKAPYRDLPWIAGVTADEGLIKSVDYFLDSNSKTELLQNYDDRLVPNVLELKYLVNNVSAATEALTDFYFKGDVIGNFDANITQMVGDAVTYWPVYRNLEDQIKKTKSNTYLYMFGYVGTFSHTFRNGVSYRFGADHGDDITYIFPYGNVKYADMQLINTVNDITVINVMCEMFTSFAKTGEPSARFTTIWEPYQKHRRYMRIGDGEDTELAMETNLFPERMTFWDEFAKKYFAPITEYRIGGNNVDEDDGKSKGKGGADGIQAGFTLLLSVTLCWIISLRLSL